jgi:hypothetical protein
MPITIHTPRQPIVSRNASVNSEGDRPHARATDEVNNGQNSPADSLGCIFAGIRERERLFGAETDAGDKASGAEQHDVGSERAKDRKRPEQQQIELVDKPSPPAIAEFALPGGADEHSKDRCTSHQRSLGGGGELGLDHIRDQRTQHDQIDDVKEVPRGDQRDHLDVERGNLRLIQR